MTDSNQESEPRTATTPTRNDGRPMKMGEMDHTPPVAGPTRAFERAEEGRPKRADGGQRPGDGATDREEEETTDGDDARGFTQTVGEMDHTPPVEGPSRTFERGNEGDGADDE